MDDLPAVLAATNYVFAQAGKPAMSLDTFRAEFCLPFKNFYDRFLPEITIEQLERDFHGHFPKVQYTVTALPHAREFLQFCQTYKIRTFLLSTVQKDYYEIQAAATEFTAYIQTPYTGVWDKRVKIKEILTENNLALDETLFIGDMQHDIDTAKHGGIFSCAVLTGYNRLEQLRASEPDLIVEHLGELQELLARNNFSYPHRTHGAEGSPMTHPIATVGALISDGHGKVLMIRTQKWSGLWGIPGGKTKYGETSPDALRREIMEETNLKIRDMKFVLVQDCIHSREFYREAHFVLLNYTCTVDGPCEVTLNEEAQEYKWVSMPEALQMKLNKPTRVLLEAVT